MRIITVLLSLIVIAVFFVTPAASAGDGSNIYWVSTNGSASWSNCESSSPLSGTSACSLSTANSNASAGDTINLMSGTYAGIEPINSGTSLNKITWQEGSGQTAILNCTEPDPIGQFTWGIYLNGVSYHIIDGIDVDCQYGNDRKWIQMNYGAHHNEIRNLTMKRAARNVGNNGVHIKDSNGNGSTHNWIHHCTLYDAGYINSSNCQDEGAVMKIANYNEDYNSGYNTIEHNIMYWGGHHVIETFSPYNIIRNNIIHNEGFMDHDPAGCDPETQGRPPDSNGLWGNRGIQIYDGQSRDGLYNLIEGNRIGHAAPAPDSNGYNNLVLTSPKNIARYNTIFGAHEKNIHLKQGGSADSENNRIYNNTILGDEGGPTPSGIFFSDASDNNVVKNNIFYNNGRDMGRKWGGNTTANNWCTVAGSEVGCDYGGDPLFVDTTSTDPTSTTQPDLTLQTTSGAIDQGTYLTQANGSGSNSTTLVVDDALFFQDGSWGSSLANTQADWIAIGTVDNTVQINSINYSTNTITLSSPKTWSDNANIWLYKDSDGTIVLYGSAPDIGAHESSTPEAPKNLRIIGTN
jgi:hypothetical protein